jgi:hypothetical protein
MSDGGGVVGDVGDVGDGRLRADETPELEAMKHVLEAERRRLAC